MKPAATKHAAMKPAPRILLVEDDAPSRAFLAAALAGLPARVATATGAGEALALAATGGPFDLWLLDAHLPDADGGALLAALRLLAPMTPALAHTATRDRRYAAALCARGFNGVLVKPVALAVLRATVRDALATLPRGLPSTLSHASASKAAAVAEARATGWFSADAAGGADANADNARARGSARSRRTTLRALFHAELPVQRASVEHALANGDFASASDVLHRLRASCGFVGAAALGAAVRALQADPGSLEALRRFGACVDAVLALAGGAIA
jgi:CheY-like chemotaxis protein